VDPVGIDRFSTCAFALLIGSKPRTASSITHIVEIPIMRVKNTLTAADCQCLEHAFEARLAAFAEPDAPEAGPPMRQMI